MMFELEKKVFQKTITSRLKKYYHFGQQNSFSFRWHPATYTDTSDVTYVFSKTDSRQTTVVSIRFIELFCIRLYGNAGQSKQFSIWDVIGYTVPPEKLLKKFVEVVGLRFICVEWILCLCG